MSAVRDTSFDTSGFLVGYGLIVHPIPTVGGLIYAEVEPAYTGWRPWRGRTSRWWYEVHEVHAPDEHGADGTTYAYTEGGSGGAFTFRGCIRKAQAAVELFVAERELESRVASAGGTLDWSKG